MFITTETALAVEQAVVQQAIGTFQPVIGPSTPATLQHDDESVEAPSLVEVAFAIVLEDTMLRRRILASWLDPCM